jgi:hypothetical protein
MQPRVACGAGTDHKALADLTTPDTILAAYTDQAEAIEAAGGQLILMASRAFTAIGATPETYHQVYRRLIDQAAQPVILHWLGDMFDPALKATGAPRTSRGLRLRPLPDRREPRQSGRHQDLPPGSGP